MRRFAIVLSAISLVAGCKGGSTPAPAVQPVTAPSLRQGAPLSPAVDLSTATARARHAFRAQPDGWLVDLPDHRVQVARGGAFSFQPALSTSGNPRRYGAPRTVARKTGAALTVETASITCGSAAASGAAVRLGDAGEIEIDRGLAVETLRSIPGGLEQGWRFARRPAASGDLVVRVRVEGQPFAGATTHGLHFADGSGLGARYGHATWIDAAGARAAIEAKLDGGAIVLTVPASRLDASRFPALLDPTLSTETGLDSPPAGTTESLPSIAWSPTTSNYLVAWTEAGAGANTNFAAQLVSSTGAVAGGGAAPVIASLVSDSQEPEVLFDGTSFLVVMMQVTPTNDNIVGVRVDPSLGTAGAPFNIVSPPGTFFANKSATVNAAGQTLVVYNSDPAATAAVMGAFLPKGASSGGAPFQIAGDGANPFWNPAAASNGTDYLVSWKNLGPSDGVYTVTVSAGGAIGAPQLVSTPTGLGTNSVQYGHVTFGAGQYFVVWAPPTGGVGASGPVTAALLSSTGSLISPAGGTQIYPTATNLASPAPVYDGSDYVVALGDQTGGVSAVFVNTSGTVVGSTLQVSTVGGQFSAPGLASDGAHHSLVAYTGSGQLLKERLITNLFANGTACSNNGQCASGNCVLGVCCNTACNPPNAAASCATGTCVFVSCNAGFADCDGNSLDSNGCETNVNSDASNCGGCGIACSSNHMATITCTGGVCSGACAAGFADCNNNKQTDGCEVNIQADASNCGGCGVVCSSNHVAVVSCGAGVCNGACVAGFADCNNNKQTDGCETNIATDVNNCGGCGVAALGGTNNNFVCSSNHITAPTCAAGVCNAACNIGWGDCVGGKTVAHNGCQTSLTAIPNCGACGATCNDSNACTNDVCNVVAGTGVCANVNLNACSQGCSAAVGCGYADTDADGLNDVWESNGYIDLNCNGVNDTGVDTPLPGANVKEPDIYVKWDYMVLGGPGGHTHMPSATAMAMVQRAMNNPTIDANDPQPNHHTHLHYFPTSDSIPENKVLSLNAPGTLVPACTGPDAVSFYTLKTAHFPSYLAPAYHYVVFAHYNTCDSTTDCNACPGTAKSAASPKFGLTGLAELPGNDAIVSLGQLVDLGVNPMPDIINAGTFMHELGHNISLRHGGGDDIIQKPNYFSVLNYSYQFGIGQTAAPGPYATSTTDPSAIYYIDYSNATCGALDEGTLMGGNCVSDGSGGMNDVTGITGTSAGDLDVTILYTNAGGTSQYAPSNGTAVAWDGNLPATNTHVYSDVNGDGLCQVLTGHDDWVQATPSVGVYQDTNFALGFVCNTGNWADGAKPPSTVEDREITGAVAATRVPLPLPGGVSYGKQCPAPGSTVNGRLEIEEKTECALFGVTVHGDVRVEDGGVLIAQGAKIAGDVIGDEPAEILIDAASSVGGDVRVRGAGAIGLAGAIAGDVSIRGTKGSLHDDANTVCSATIGGELVIDDSERGAPFDVGGCARCAAGSSIAGDVTIEHAGDALTFERNTVGRNLSCRHDASVTSGGNSVAGASRGPCAPNPPITCP